jgi:hypothetical protein
MFSSSKNGKVDAKTVVIQDLSDRIAKQAEDAIKIHMPAKVLRLHNMIESSDLLRNVVPVKVTEFEDDHTTNTSATSTKISASSDEVKANASGEQTTKKRKVDETLHDRCPMAKRMIVKPNTKIQEVGEQVKKEVLEGIELLGVIKVFLHSYMHSVNTTSAAYWFNFESNVYFNISI